MKLIVGLGNPGTQYALTRHNIGFMAIDAFHHVHGGGSWKSEHKAETCRIRLGEEQILLAKPQTFMNLSGQSVQAMMAFHKIEKTDILICHDEVDIKFATMKFQVNRGHGGHNGIRNIHELLGGNDYARLKLGVGRPPQYIDDDGKVTRPTMEVVDWVLKQFSKEEFKAMPDFLSNSCDAIECFIKDGLEKASNRFNQKG
jgi:peptidyl-tRNA hydrolase, PTH1 family